MEKGYPTAVRFSHYPSFIQNVSDFVLGRYHFKRLPSKTDLLELRPEESMMEFDDIWIQGQMASHPLGEAKLLLAWMGTQLDMEIKIQAFMTRNINASAESYKKIRKERVDIPEHLDKALQKLLVMEPKLQQQYLRACSTYQLSLQTRQINAKLALVLFVCAIECLASIIIETGGAKSKFRQFILDNLPTNVKRDRILGELLNATYKVRSEFIHGSQAIIANERQEFPPSIRALSTVKNGKKKFVINPDWFRWIVRQNLIEFLKRQPKPKGKLNKLILNKIASQEEIITVYPKKWQENSWRSSS